MVVNCNITIFLIGPYFDKTIDIGDQKSLDTGNFVVESVTMDFAFVHHFQYDNTSVSVNNIHDKF